MKRAHLLGIATIISAIGLAGVTGCSVTDSTNIKTSGIWARYDVDHDIDDRVTVRGVLRVGGSTGTIINLTMGEHLEVNGVEMTEYVEPITNYQWSRAVINPSVDDLYDIDLIRTDEIVPTTMEVPELPLITDFEPAGLLVYSDETLTVYWDNSVPGDEISVYVGGSCIEDQSYALLSDTGEFTTDPLLDASVALPEDCELTISVTRHYIDAVNPAFQGGYTEATRTDEAYVDFESTLP